MHARLPGGSGRALPGAAGKLDFFFDVAAGLP